VKLPPANTLPAGFTPDLPPIAHFSHLLKLTYDFFAREDVERMCVSYCPSPSSGVTSRLEKILERYQSGTAHVLCRAGDDVIAVAACLSID